MDNDELASMLEEVVNQLRRNSDTNYGLKVECEICRLYERCVDNIEEY